MTTTNDRAGYARERARKAARARALTDPLGAKGFRRSRQRIARETRARRGIVAAAIAFFLACFGLIAAQGIAQSDQPSSQAPRAVAEVSASGTTAWPRSSAGTRTQRPSAHVRTRAS